MGINVTTPTHTVTQFAHSWPPFDIRFSTFIIIEINYVNLFYFKEEVCKNCGFVFTVFMWS